MELQNTLRDLFAGRRQPNVRLGAIENIIQNEPQEVVEIIDPAILPDVPVEVEVAVEDDKEPADTCTVCLEELTAENTHGLRCGHKAVCKYCHPTMMTMNIGNGCVGEDPETCVKVIKCPICRREDTPTREQLIAEIVRMRRGGYIRPLPRVPVPLPVHAPVPRHQPINHNLPAVIPVLHPVIQHNQPAPINAQVAQANLNHAVQQVGGRVRAPRAPRAPRVAHAPPPVPPNPNALDGDWLRAQNHQPVALNHQHDNFNRHVAVPRWNIMRGHSIATCQEVQGFLAGGQGARDGWVCGDEEDGVARFYHHDFFVPIQTEGAVPSRRLCGRGAQCTHNQQSRTARRCTRGCGQFICQHCGTCNRQECQQYNN